MSWSAPTPWPHYIRVDLGKKVKGVSFWYKGRNNANNDNPKHITIFASNKAGDTLLLPKHGRLVNWVAMCCRKAQLRNIHLQVCSAQQMISSISGFRLTKLIPAASGLLWPS